MDAHEVLDLPMKPNDSGKNTIRGYLKELLSTLWEKDEGFSGKRPFGNSSWRYDLYQALIEGGAIGGTLDDEGDISELDTDAADKIIHEAIEALS